MQIKKRPEFPTRQRKIPEPSEYLEHRFRQNNEAIAESSRALLKAQLEARHHTLTKESWMAVVKKYRWQNELPLSLM